MSSLNAELTVIPVAVILVYRILKVEADFNSAKNQQFHPFAFCSKGSALDIAMNQESGCLCHHATLEDEYVYLVCLKSRQICAGDIESHAALALNGESLACGPPTK